MLIHHPVIGICRIVFTYADNIVVVKCQKESKFHFIKLSDTNLNKLQAHEI